MMSRQERTLTFSCVSTEVIFSENANYFCLMIEAVDINWTNYDRASHVQLSISRLVPLIGRRLFKIGCDHR